MTTPFRATMQASFGSIPEDVVDALGDELMESLLNSKAAVDPVVSGDMDAGEVALSFEFDAVGEYHQDVRRALEILAEVAGDRLTAAGISRDLTPTGTVQYPLAEAV